jgi:hypothetical protein
MSGVATPVQITEAFGISQVPPYINTIPPTTGTPGAASYDLGFPAATMTDPGLGGVPPSGADMNGILNAVSSWCAALQAGQNPPVYSSAVSTAISGYKAGAMLASASHVGRYYINFVNGNTNDPDSTITGWMSTVPLYATSSPSGGTHADNVLPGYSDYILDYDTTAGAVTLNGFVAQRDGQRITINCTGANNLTIGALSGSAGNQVRASSGTTIVQNDSFTIQYCAAITAWVVV